MGAPLLDVGTRAGGGVTRYRYTLTSQNGSEMSFWLHDVRLVTFTESTLIVSLDGVPDPVRILLKPDTARATYGQLMQAWAEAT